MTGETKRFLQATTALIGTIIGVGIFGIPYAISLIGVVGALIYFAALGSIQLLQHLFYAEAAIATTDRVRLPGLVEKFLGKRAKSIVAVSTVFGFWAGQLAYILVGGTFLSLLLTPYLGGQEFYYQLAWAIVGSLVIYFGLEFVSKISFFTTSGLLIAMLTVLAIGFPHIRYDHFVVFAGRDFILPYGVILFALSGLAAIPEMEDVFQGKHRNYRRAIIVGTVLAAALTAAFGFVVWGITGPATTQDSVAGLRAALGRGITTLTSVFGFLAVTTSYFVSGTNLRSTFQYDYKLHKVPAWLLTVGVPVGIFFIGAKNFVSIISFSGAVFGGITAISVSLLYIAVTKKKLVKERPLGVPLWAAYVSIAILALGAAYEIAVSAAKLFR